MQVWKFPLELDSNACETKVEMPLGATILTIGPGSSGVNILALVDPEAETVERSFLTVGNGVDLPEGIDALYFRGSVKLPNLSLSVFETTEVPAAA